MATGPRYIVRPKRRGSLRTNYRKRIKMLEGRTARLVVRISNRHIRAQVIEYTTKGDKTLVSAGSTDLSKYGWKGGTSNTPAAYLTGLLCGKRAVKAGIKKAVFDIGVRRVVPGSNLFAVLKGAIDAGFNVPSNAQYPSEERISGQHIAEYAAKLKPDKGAYSKQFSEYLKKNTDPETIPDAFSALKDKIIGE